ncbi:MAG: hypothetical protein AMXMBFR33_65450 [Candidatus Xenobia bacterium]
MARLPSQTPPLLNRLDELRAGYAPPASWQREPAMELLRGDEELAAVLIDLERAESQSGRLRLDRALQRADRNRVTRPPMDQPEWRPASKRYTRATSGDLFEAMVGA